MYKNRNICSIIKVKKNEVFAMKEQIKRAMQHNQIVDIMYIAQDSSITKRRIKLIKIVGNTVQAYCFTRHAKRTFKFENILAVRPVLSKVSELNA